MTAEGENILYYLLITAQNALQLTHSISILFSNFNEDKEMTVDKDEVVLSTTA